MASKDTDKRQPDIISAITATDWTTTHWDITDVNCRIDAARAIALKFAVVCVFGNIVALVFNPSPDSMTTVNLAKGRPAGQVASVTTTREHINSLFDWSKIPIGLSADLVLTIIDAFYGLGPYSGPFGFRGPAAEDVPQHLTDFDADTGVRTVQLIAPGYRCPSNVLFEHAIQEIRRVEPHATVRWLAATSANISSSLTGQQEPAHYRLVSRVGIKSDFGSRTPRFVMIGYPDEAHEARVRRSYPHDPNSTTIIDFSRAYRCGRTMAVHLRRRGSLSDKRTERVLNSLGIRLLVDEKERTRLPLRRYPDTSQLQLLRERMSRRLP